MKSSRNNMFLRGTSLAVLFLLPPVPEPKPLTASAIFERESRYIATIRTYDNQGNPIGQGSGVVMFAYPLTRSETPRVVFNPGGVVVATNLHVLRGACNVSVEVPGLGSKPIWGIAGLDSDNDVVLVTVHGEPLSYRRPKPESTTLRPGDPIYAIGNPMGVGLSITEGVVSGIRSTLQGRRIQISTPISPGSSGGGLYDRFGRLVGITASTMEGGQNLNFAIPIEAVVRPNLSETASDWSEARGLFCGAGGLSTTLDELRAVLGSHVANPNVRDFFSRLGGGRIPEPSRVDLPGFPAIRGDITNYSFFSSLGLVYQAKDGVLYNLVLYGPGMIEGADTYYTGDLPFSLEWGMSGHEVREKFGSRYRKDDKVYEKDQELLLFGQRGNYYYSMIGQSGKLVLVEIEVPLP